MINVVCGIRSTGRICTDLADALDKQGHTVKIAFGREMAPETYRKYAVRIGTDTDVKLHGIKARLFDACGFGSRKATERFIDWVKEFDPDVIHLHNVHGYYINVEVLFSYLRTCGKRIIWTLHDCWAFTGHAAYCQFAQCERWIEGCHDCPNHKEYPASLIDRSEINWKRKKTLFSEIPGLTVVTPSEWLSGLVRESFLSNYDVKVIHNGVDTDVFKPTVSGIRNRLGIRDKKMLLGVASLWEKRKGLEDIIKLSELLPENYQIVLVGLSKQQIEQLPEKIIGVERTNSVNELAELYSAADIFINPTYEDNYPTTNLEAIACGTPVISYDTGGSGESAVLFGATVEKGDLKALLEAIKNYEPRPSDGIDIGMEGFISDYVDLF